MRTMGNETVCSSCVFVYFGIVFTTVPWYIVHGMELYFQSIRSKVFSRHLSRDGQIWTPSLSCIYTLTAMSLWSYVQATNEAIKNLSAFVGKNEVGQVALKEGIIKYSDMSATAHKFANELQEKFFDHFSAYLNNYGYNCESIFRQDNMDLLLEYEVY